MTNREDIIEDILPCSAAAFFDAKASSALRKQVDAAADRIMRRFAGLEKGNSNTASALYETLIKK